MAVGAAVGANSHDDRRRLPAQTLSHSIIFRKHRAIKSSDPTHNARTEIGLALYLKDEPPLRQQRAGV